MARILVVEDHADSREALMVYLSRAGHSIDSAANGREAMAHIIDRAPDVVVLDLSMPEMNGADVLAAVRSYVRLHSLPVVILTAWPEGPLAVQAESMHVSAILKKGTATLTEISSAIQTALTNTMHPSAMRLEKWRSDEISPL
jgi:CheY-like chemotaxis protein